MTFFRFEADFVESLRCVPMAVRQKLDLAGVKLKLAEWSKLPPAEKALLVSRPCATPGEIDGWRAYIEAAVVAACGAGPALMPPADQIWESREVPPQVLEKAASVGERIPQDTWAGLTSLQRFALVKLSRPGHENRNFLPALREFGIAGK